MVPFVPLALIPPLPRTIADLSRSVVLSVLPDGGQRIARRNAWAGMSENSARGRAQREADLAVEAARSRVRARTQQIG